eukprot:Tamp_08999.p1 GENE.Tamp_08999~~Tamp_08999.p1  ORF type:complete len:209 (+),score=63.62 Tamp_08999:328-954(+)
MVDYLLQNKADATIVTSDNWSPVHDAARAGSEKCLRSLKQAGADMTLQTGNGSTALHYAAQYDKVDIVKYFLGALDGTEGLVDIANASGQTALHVAARHGKDKTVEALISFNANTLLLDKIGRSAEALAEEFKFPVVVTLLQEAAVAQREAQVSSAELELKNAEEAEMVGDKQKQIDALTAAAAAFTLASDPRAVAINEKVAELKAGK